VTVSFNQYNNKEHLILRSDMTLGRRRGFVQDTQYMQDLLNTQHYSLVCPYIYP